MFRKRSRPAAARLELSRRDWLRLTAFGATGAALSGWMESLANAATTHPQRKRACILLWMTGGPSQMDTFDLKPGHANGGPFQAIATSVPGIEISEHLPKVARWMHRMAMVRSMKSGEGEHQRATLFLHTGYPPQGPVKYPTLGSVVAKELGDRTSALPNFVSIAPFRAVSPAAYEPGFLGASYAPLVVADAASVGPGPSGGGVDEALKVRDVDLPAGTCRREADARVDLLRGLHSDFSAGRPGAVLDSYRAALDRALKLSRTDAARAFHLEEEPAALREAYGRNLFGQGCLLARRLVERGVPFVEVSLGGLGNNLNWDTHQNNFDAVKQLSQVLDPAWAALMDDLMQRGLLDSTLVVWMGEFGRTPKINRQSGRDHHTAAWSTVLAGGGIRGGQVIGKTTPDGVAVAERPVSVQDFLATVCLALGIDPKKHNSTDGRPIRLVDRNAEPLREALS
jgi:hypothetical protein